MPTNFLGDNIIFNFDAFSSWVLSTTASPSTSSSTPDISSPQTINSLSSTTAFHPTLFENLNLRAQSVYNFYTADESSAFTSDLSASLDSLPRYVKLTWNPASAPRNFTLSRKGLKPFDDRIPTVQPAIELSAAKNAVANGYIAPGTVQALLVPPTVVQNTPQFDEDFYLASSHIQRSAPAIIDSDSDFHVTSIPSPSIRIRVNFIDPSIAGALDENRIAMASDHVHLASLGSFSKLASGLEVISEFNQDIPLRNPVPVFPAPINTPDLMYIGYILERYTLGTDGSMVLSRSVIIDDPGQSDFIDREVVYEGRYSYRIRALIQWAHAYNVGFFGTSSLDRPPLFDTSAGSTARQASFIACEWSDWARVAVLDEIQPDPPDELIVIPMSSKETIRVVWKCPNNPRGDIASVTLLRSTGQNGIYSDWVTLVRTNVANGCFVDTDAKHIESSGLTYMYAMYSTTYHGLRSTLGDRIEVSLTERSRYFGENPIRRIGPRGDDPLAHARGPVGKIPSELIAVNRAVFYNRDAQSSIPLFDRPYVVEIQSLSTGERAEILLNVDTTDVDVTSIGTTRSA